MRARLVLGSAAVVMLLIASASACLAQQRAADPQRGRELARRLCTTCHVIDRDASTPSRTADVPSFPAIADRAGVTAAWIAGAIIIPHPAMPDVRLTMQEVRDVVAYILSLKNN